MNSKYLLWIALALVAVLVVSCGIFGKRYYDARYVGADYYAMVPLDFDMTQKDMKSMNGEVVGQGIEYRLTAFNDQGESKDVNFSVADPDGALSIGEQQPLPGTFLWISASQQIVVHWTMIDQSEVPPAALEQILH